METIYVKVLADTILGEQTENKKFDLPVAVFRKQNKQTNPEIWHFRRP